MTKKFKFFKKAPKEDQTVFLLAPSGCGSSYATFTWAGKGVENHWLISHRVYPTLKDVKRADKFVKDFIKSHKEQLNYITSEPKPGTEVWSGAYMDGSTFDDYRIIFDPNNEYHQLLLKLGLLYNSSDMVIEASKIITKALDMKQKD